MRIGELSARTGTSRRLLRYYEEQGLIVSQRCANGYRSYDERLADRVLQIRGLLDAGLPTRVIKQILPCLDKPRVIVFSDATPEIIDTLGQELDRMNRRIDALVRNRNAVAEYLAEVSAHTRRAPGALPPPVPVPAVHETITSR
ncbi:MerR family transcriptional regulator [Actinoplanes cyaneus]|uniref:MerR family transcriptional regulator n=1 Tax=Actinoplanes cyaneus TaxID=52696 RepID=A0A919M713_9ACTN|nr:MerR family transcriptional regulator [Actinoplanes cyaneus]MCW2137824.1 DNA-binding transcriptional regulator, MerR family [Actinoplanes cyaneus]GID64969.1 MerR family transcriptional regulator [Actinoplanes cyaneus]